MQSSKRIEAVSVCRYGGWGKWSGFFRDTERREKMWIMFADATGFVWWLGKCDKIAFDFVFLPVLRSAYMNSSSSTREVFIFQIDGSNKIFRLSESLTHSLLVCILHFSLLSTESLDNRLRHIDVVSYSKGVNCPMTTAIYREFMQCDRLS